MTAVHFAGSEATSTESDRIGPTETHHLAQPRLASAAAYSERMSGNPDPVRPGTKAFKADLYSVYARLRNEIPVLRVTLPDRRPARLVTRYEDVAATLRDPRFAKDKKNARTPE